MNKEDKKSLHKRYLFWLYKTTKDELDKIDRKFTQLDIDRDIEKILSSKEGISEQLKEWKEYIIAKESDALKLKFANEGSVDPRYLFLSLKLEAIEHITKKMLGRRILLEFKKLYEDTSLRAIAQDTSGRR